MNDLLKRKIANHINDAHLKLDMIAMDINENLSSYGDEEMLQALKDVTDVSEVLMLGIKESIKSMAQERDVV